MRTDKQNSDEELPPSADPSSATAQLLKELNAKGGFCAPPEHNHDFESRELVTMLADLADGRILDAKSAQRVPSLLRTLARASEITRKLAINDKNVAVTGPSSKSLSASDLALHNLVHETLRNIDALGRLPLQRLREVSMQFPEFPVKVNGHPSSLARVKKSIQDLDLGGHHPVLYPTSRTKRDALAELVCLMIDEIRLHDKMEPMTAPWKELSVHVKETAIPRIAQSEESLVERIRGGYKAKSVVGKAAKLEQRLISDILSRLKSYRGENKV